MAFTGVGENIIYMTIRFTGSLYLTASVKRFPRDPTLNTLAYDDKGWDCYKRCDVPDSIPV